MSSKKSMINYFEGQLLGNNIKFIQRDLNNPYKARFVCHCGNEFTTKICDVKANKSKSCGCLNNFKNKKNKVRGFRTSHGLYRTKEYYTLQGILQRCFNVNNKRYKDYGGRGIKVCQEWVENFETFLDDMGFAPSKKHSIDRINNDGDYCKENCRWATDREQFENRSTTTFITYNGKTLSRRSWSELTGISITCIRHRLKRNWPIDKTLNYYQD